MCDQIINIKEETCKFAELSHSPESHQSSPAWCKEVLGVQGAPGGWRSTPGAAGEQESLLSASCLPVCLLVSRVRDTESQEGPTSSPDCFLHPLSAFQSRTGHWPMFCLHSHLRVKNKHVKEQSSAPLSLALCSDSPGSWQIKHWTSKFRQHHKKSIRDQDLRDGQLQDFISCSVYFVVHVQLFKDPVHHRKQLLDSKHTEWKHFIWSLNNPNPSTKRSK